jgi:coenzyme F420-reducing hydrogenase alpha subunit
VSGDIVSSVTGISSSQGYLDIITEFIVPYSTAKFVRHSGGSYAVGALARFNHNYQQLRPLAKEAAGNLRLKVPCYNPFMNNLAQLIEVIHEVESALDYINLMIETGLDEEQVVVTPKAGRGVGIVEAPRGLLIHDYTYDRSGGLVTANCIIPTNQNCANIEDDLRSLVLQNMNQGQQEIKRLSEMLVRSYDPCIGCSTH